MDRDRSYWEQSGSPFHNSTGADGTRALKLGPHRYWFHASTKDGRAGVVDVDLTAGIPEVLTIRVGDQGEVRVKFADTFTPGTRVRAEDSTGRVLWGGTFTTPWPRSIKLLPGKYSFVVVKPGHTESRTPFNVEIGSSVDLVIP